MTRAVLRHVRWLISRDTSPGAPSDAVREECTTCAGTDLADGVGSRSPASHDQADGQMWALRHSGRNPTHTGYREIITRFWRTSLVEREATSTSGRPG